MITVLINASHDGEALSRSLVPLVEGAMEGVISSVLVISSDHGPNAEIDRICDLSGAKHVQAPNLGNVIAEAKDKWLLILEAGARLEGPWLNGSVDHMNSTSNIGRFALAPLHNQTPWWRRICVKNRNNSPLRQGCLIPKSAAITTVKNAANLEALARGRAMKLIQGGRILPRY